MFKRVNKNLIFILIFVFVFIGINTENIQALKTVGGTCGFTWGGTDFPYTYGWDGIGDEEGIEIRERIKKIYHGGPNSGWSRYEFKIPSSNNEILLMNGGRLATGGDANKLQFYRIKDDGSKDFYYDYEISSSNGNMEPKKFHDLPKGKYGIAVYAETSSSSWTQPRDVAWAFIDLRANIYPDIWVPDQSVDENETLKVDISEDAFEPHRINNDETYWNPDKLEYKLISGSGELNGDEYKMETNYYGENDAGDYTAKVRLKEVSDGFTRIGEDSFDIKVHNVYRETTISEPDPPDYKNYPDLPSHPGNRPDIPNPPVVDDEPYEPQTFSDEIEPLDCDIENECPDSDDYIEVVSKEDEPEEPENIYDYKNNESVDASASKKLMENEENQEDIVNLLKENSEGYNEFDKEKEKYEEEIEVYEKRKEEYDKKMELREIIQNHNKSIYDNYVQEINDWNENIKNKWDDYETNYNNSKDDYDNWLEQRKEYLDTVEEIKDIEDYNERKRDNYQDELDKFYDETIPDYEYRYDKVNINKADKEPPSPPSYNTSIEEPHNDVPSYQERPGLLDPVYPGDEVIGEKDN